MQSCVEMRILYISNNSSTGGAPAALLNLVRQLKDRHEIAVMMPDSKGPLFHQMAVLGVKTYTSCNYVLSIWPRVLNPIKYLSRIFGLFRNRNEVRVYVGSVLDEFKPDVVHTNVGPLDIASEECRKRGIPHIWHLREYQDKDFGMTYFPGGKTGFRSLLSQKNNHCLAITEGVYAHWGLSGDSKVIYDGVISPVPYEKVNKAGYFLYAARIEKGKGLHVLLKAFRKYCISGGRLRLLVAGRPCGIYAYLCRMYVRLYGMADAVEFLGNRSDVFDLMRRADALVVPSRFEGFGFTTAEAMYNRCPVIGNDTAGTKEQFDNGLKQTGTEIGLRFHDVEQLAEHLAAVENGDFGEMVDSAYTVVTTLYTVERYAAQVEAYYKTVR